MKTKLYELRLKKGLFQKDVAKDCNIKVRTYASYENGTNEPSLTVLCELAKYFDVTTDRLLGISEDQLLFDNARVARVQKSEIQEVFDELDPRQQENVLTYARALKAMNDDASNVFSSRHRA